MNFSTNSEEKRRGKAEHTTRGFSSQSWRSPSQSSHVQSCYIYFFIYTVCSFYFQLSTGKKKVVATHVFAGTSRVFQWNEEPHIAGHGIVSKNMKTLENHLAEWQITELLESKPALNWVLMGLMCFIADLITSYYKKIFLICIKCIFWYKVGFWIQWGTTSPSSGLGFQNQCNSGIQLWAVKLETHRFLLQCHSTLWSCRTNKQMLQQ